MTNIIERLRSISGGAINCAGGIRALEVSHD